MKKDLQNIVCLVTGGSRGVGRGVALGLGERGATVYVTGRTKTAGTNPLPGTVFETAEAVTAAGGKGIAVVCDHADDKQVAAVIEQIKQEQGKLHILVNNAIALPEGLTDAVPFWEKGLRQLDILNVGMRSHIAASILAAPLLVQTGNGLVVNVSSPGGRCYMHGVSYGSGKAATDKMAHDMAHDFKPHGVDVVTIWPGLVKTERTVQLCEQEPDKYGGIIGMAESPEYQGRVVAALFASDKRSDYTGSVQYSAELAEQLGVVDTDGSQRMSGRAMFGDPPVFSAAVVE